MKEDLKVSNEQKFTIINTKISSSSLENRVNNGTNFYSLEKEFDLINEFWRYINIQKLIFDNIFLQMRNLNN